MRRQELEQQLATAYTAYMRVLVAAKQPKAAERVLVRFRRHGLQPDGPMLTSVMQGYAITGECVRGYDACPS